MVSTLQQDPQCRSSRSPTSTAEPAAAAALEDALVASASHEPALARRLVNSLAPGLGAIVLVVLIWEAVVFSGWKPEWVLPGPGAVMKRLWDLLSAPDTWMAVRVTMGRALFGYGIAVVVGTLLGLVMSRVRLLRKAFGGLMTGLQTMPSIAWFPLAILLFQISESAIFFVVLLGAAPSVANGLLDAIDNLPPLLVRAGRALGARGSTLIRRVILPAALPGFVSGLKQGWAFSWRSLMAGELIVIIGDRPSVGTRLSFARELSDAELLLAWMILVLAIGLLVHAFGFGLAERRMLRKRGLLGGH
jgi:NitT/TauT family transport system permease protein